MRRSVAARLVGELIGPADLVICSLGSTGRAWREQGVVNLTYYASDPMGMAPSLALGLALAQRERQVVLLEGDGDLAMNLGVLITIAGAAPSNLRIVVFQNGRYETGGGQPLAANDRLSFATIALGAGFPWAAETGTETEAEECLRSLFDRPGPGLVALRVEPEPSPYPAAGPWSQVEERALFMRRLAGEL